MGDNSFKDKRRDREKEADEADQGNSKNPSAPVKGQIGTSDKVDQLLTQAKPLIEQINALYNQYISGIEQFPPNDKRKMLEGLMAQIQSMSKPTQSIQFKANSLLQHFMTYREKWDRILRDLEAGKIRRRV